jgi:hypothetical protein
MSMPYENATSGKKAVDEMQKILQEFGCGSFGQMMNFETGELLVQFTYREKQVSVKASAKGYAIAWLKKNPFTHRTRSSKTEYEKKALQIGSVAVYSILRDWIKGQVTAVETGILSFEGAFLGQIMLGNGKTVMEHVAASGLLQIESKAANNG